MSRICVTICRVMILGIMIAGCARIHLPGKQDVIKVFTTSNRPSGIVSPAPKDVPVLAIAEMDDWHALCDQCHRGPHYSSQTILEWGHLDSCVANKPCHDCHSQSLHLTRIRGDKAKCYECHLQRQLPVACDTCHGQGCWDQYLKHDPGFIDNHGDFITWQSLECLTCHGSEAWCLSCHGVPMPHAEDINENHASLVQGRPELCNKCHGEQSCETCHRENDVEFTLEDYLREQLGLTVNPKPAGSQ